MSGAAEPSGTERLPRLRPADLDDAQQRLYTMITGGERARDAALAPLVDAHGGIEGPFGPLLHHPDLGAALQQVGVQLRYRAALDDRARELATLWVAVGVGSRYEWRAHEPLALRAGVRPAEIAELRDGVLPSTLSAAERAAAELAAGADLDDERFAQVLALLGARGIVEAITLGGYYRLLARLLDTFAINDPVTAPETDPAR